MQEQVNEKTIALYIKTGKLTAQTLQKAMKSLLNQMKKQKDRQPHGKQTLKQLMKQNAGVSNIEITGDNIKAFESTAKKYGIDFALKKDTTENPPRYLVFFKGRDADVLTAAFKEFSAKKLTQDKKPYNPRRRDRFPYPWNDRRQRMRPAYSQAPRALPHRREGSRASRAYPWRGTKDPPWLQP